MSNLRKIRAAGIAIAQSAKRFDISVLQAFYRTLRFSRESLFSIEEITFWGLASPDIKGEAIHRYISTETRVRLDSRMNSQKSFELVSSKEEFQAHCESHGFPVPKLLFTIPAGESGLSNEQLLHFTEKLIQHAGDEILCKPIHGMNGDGIVTARVVDRRGELESGGKHYDVTAFIEHLHEINPGDGYIVQERLRAHTSLAALSGTDAIQSLRIVSFIDTAGSFHVLFTRLKIVVGDNETDNFSGGVPGNLIANVDPELGTIRTALKKMPGQVGLEKLDDHPVTKQRMIGFSIPHYSEAIDLVERAARSLPGLNLLGWDVALTTRGPVILETNQRWAPFSSEPVSLPVPRKVWKELLRPLPRGS